MGPGATGWKQLADFTGHIIFYGHPKKNVRLRRDLSLFLSLFPCPPPFISVDTIERSTACTTLLRAVMVPDGAGS